ncbi:DoxX family membrane protein [Pontibacter sp. 172403-2]|uniref:DoxX family membrane protein n=1 Tax=Pontibacter rufus TaxID=2791028 RepID=UPI0018AFAC21|nr:DoxX family membrane protein [Pontibacter sp. 172403-2]MBF9252607.1 DoxX family membrane protein [Pontibacter sp. 172403-2]
MDTVAQNQTLHHVRTTLRLTYGILPIVAGLDKFTNLLTDWEKYLNPTVAEMLPFSPHTFMLIVGVIEIIAGVLVFVKPRIGAYVVMAWLIGIALNLILSGGLYLDIAVRDLVMAIGAFTLAKVTEATTETSHFKANIQGRPAATPLY